MQAFATAVMTALEPARPSPPMPPPICPPVRTQEMFPWRTSSANQATLGSLSRPEKPPMPATSAPDSMIACDAPDWLATATVPPPWAVV